MRRPARGKTQSTTVAIVLLSILSLLTPWIGGTLALKLGKSDRAIAAGIGFSVGIMLLIALLGLIPQAGHSMGLRATMTSFALGAALVWTAHVIAMHDIPEEFAMPVPAMPTRSKRVLHGSALLSALAEPAAAPGHDRGVGRRDERQPTHAEHRPASGRGR